jgi:hypothetical protein
MRKAFELVDEVWVGTEFIADALRPLSPVPVVKVKTPVAPPPIVPFSNAELGLPEGFVFLFIFDYHSVFERKDPIRLIEAFQMAFEAGEGASLVIKCMNDESDPENHDRLRLAARSHPDIHIIDEYVSVERKDAMLASCDCYVSLHRAEGFGLPLAEAMYHGKPVIATRYSGNLDFMTDANSFLVDYELRPVGEGHAPYPASATWASADQTHAARLMRSVFEQPMDAERRGRRAAADIRRAHSPEAAGETMERRLETIRTHLAQRRPLRHVSSRAPAQPEPTRLEELIDRVPGLRQTRAAAPVRRVARRVTVRARRAATNRELQFAKQMAEIDQVRRRSGAQIATVLAELRSQDAALRSIRAEVAALRAARRVNGQQKQSSDRGAPAALSPDAPPKPQRAAQAG